MAGLKILLLWAGIISLANCITQAPSPQCSFNVTAIKFGFQVDMLKSTNAGSTISFKEKGQPGEPIVQSFNQSSHQIQHLKPCTEYELNVTYIDSAGNETCKTEITTLNMIGDDVVDGSCMPGYVCYQSEWDISSSLSTSNSISVVSCSSDMKEFCIKPAFNDICTNFTTTFTSVCGAPFSLSRSIPVDFLDPTQINQTVSKEFPAKIESKLPPNCNLTIDYTCQKANELNTRKLSELEPFTDYSCTGQVKHNDTLNLTTTVDFRIDCDLTIGLTKEAVTNTSIELSWDTTSQKCQSELPHLEKLSYDCSCEPSSRRHKHRTKTNPSGGACIITGLKPYTKYSCEVQSKYDNKSLYQPTEVTHTTKIGIPENITSLTVNVPEHNVITVTCDYDGKHFNGPKKEYHARLHGVTEKVNKDKCFFEFKDLSYSTEYKLEVTVFNGEFCSKPKKYSVSTSYNDKAVIGLLVFVIISIIASVVVAVYKIYVLRRTQSRSVVNEDVMLKLTATYANVPRSEDRLMRGRTD